jgi:predicted nucleic acid-binding protein
MARLVVDASVAIKWFVLEAGADRALDLIAPGLELVAPDLLLLEVIALLSRRVREGLLDERHARTDVADLPKFFAQFVPSIDLSARAFDISLAVGHPLYDCVYLALAAERGVPVVTADVKLVQRLAGTGYARHVVLLSDWKG